MGSQTVVALSLPAHSLQSLKAEVERLLESESPEARREAESLRECVSEMLWDMVKKNVDNGVRLVPWPPLRH